MVIFNGMDARSLIGMRDETILSVNAGTPQGRNPGASKLFGSPRGAARHGLPHLGLCQSELTLQLRKLLAEASVNSVAALAVWPPLASH